MAKNFPKSTKEIMVQIQEVLTSLKKDQLNIYTHTEAHELKTHTHTGILQKICKKPHRKKNTVWKQP